MNKTIKSLVAIALVSVATGSAIFAAPKTTARNSDTTIEQSEKVIKTLSGKVKAPKNGTIKFEAKNGKKYVIITSGENPEEDATILTVIKNRNNKSLILSGFVDDEAETFTVIRVGGLNNNQAEK